jgi:hypothetical protein
MSVSIALSPVVMMGRYCYFPALGFGEGLSHETQPATGEAILTPQALVLHFRAPPDEVCFELDRAVLPSPAAWLARHALRCRSRPLAPASVSYHFTRTTATGPTVNPLLLSDEALRLMGNLTITAYDTQHQLLSGYYQVRAPQQPDPTKATRPHDPTCLLLLAGDFANLRLQVK